MTHMKGRPAEKYHVVNDFGAIGSALPAAIGIAAARGDGKVMLIEGDGSLLMHIQELETIRRQGIRMLISVMNDGGYGAEVTQVPRPWPRMPARRCTAAATWRASPPGFGPARQPR